MWKKYGNLGTQFPEEILGLNVHKKCLSFDEKKSLKNFGLKQLKKIGVEIVEDYSSITEIVAGFPQSFFWQY